MVMVACGDAFTVAIGAGEGGRDEGWTTAGIWWVILSTFLLELFLLSSIHLLA